MALQPQLRLPLDARDRAGLAWLEQRCRRWAVWIRRRRKRIPRGPLSPDEIDALQALDQVADGLRTLTENSDRR